MSNNFLLLSTFDNYFSTIILPNTHKIKITKKKHFLGNVPGRPQGGRHGMVFGQIPVSSTTVPLVPGSTYFSQNVL